MKPGIRERPGLLARAFGAVLLLGLFLWLILILAAMALVTFVEHLAR